MQIPAKWTWVLVDDGEYISFCALHSHVHVAASYLLIIERSHGPTITRMLAVRLLRDALTGKHYKLAGNVLRFISTTRQDASGNVDRNEEVQAALQHARACVCICVCMCVCVFVFIQ